MTLNKNIQGDPNAEFWAEIQRNIIVDDTDSDRIYGDWTASGRLYRPIEIRLSNVAGSVMANTHTEDSYTGRQMSRWLAQANAIIKRHVNASANDVLLNVGNGMTGALAKLIHLLGYWCHESHRGLVAKSLIEKPLVYITHREHHSNQTMWLESLAEVRIIPSLAEDEIDLDWLQADLMNESQRKVKIASVTAASNVTGIFTPFHQIAQLMHQHNGICFVDFAASAPYVNIDMHPNEHEYLDAIFFSPHKFLGGPGSNGVLVFNQNLYHNEIPETPGGGTVVWTNPWGQHRYIRDIEQRESGGTPGILQTLKTAMAVQLKEEMGIERIASKERLLNEYLFKRFDKMANIEVLSGHQRERLSIFSIVFKNLDYKRAVQILSDEFKLETRGGCACAGTYGHHLLGIDQCMSNLITQKLDEEIENEKPGWVRLSLHPSMSLAQLQNIADAIEKVSVLTMNHPVQPTPNHENLWAPLI